MSLHYCIKTGLIKIGQKYFLRMSQSSTSWEVMGDNMYNNLKVKDMIANSRFQQLKMMEDVLWFEEYFLQKVLLL